MQPTYLPWIGYFDLMDRADVFIYLDNVQFAKRSWQQRNKIKTPDGEMWLTVPVSNKGKYRQQIRDVETDEGRSWRKGHFLALKLNYSRAAHFDRAIGLFERMYSVPRTRLAEMNIEFIEGFKRELGITCRTARASEIDGTGTEDPAGRLVRLCRAVGATAYLSPEGSREYLNEGEAFTEAGMKFEYHRYRHPVYRQLFGEFVSHLSVADLLLNEGSRSLEIIRSGRSQVDPARIGGPAQGGNDGS